MHHLEWITIIICIAAALLHGLSGFGFPMMSTAALSMQYSLSHAVALVIIPCLVLNIIVLNSDPQRSLGNTLSYFIQQYWPLLLTCLIGSIWGVKLLFWVDESYLKLLMGVVLIGYVLDQCRASPFRVSANTFNMLIFGLSAGVIGGATNAMAPFLMMYLLSCQLPKTDIVIISNLSFVIGKLIQLLLLYPVIISFDQHQYGLIALITLFAIFGVMLGNKLRQFLTQGHFKTLVLLLLFALGLNSLWQSALLF